MQTVLHSLKLEQALKMHNLCKSRKPLKYLKPLRNVQNNCIITNKKSTHLIKTIIHNDMVGKLNREKYQ